MKCFVVFTILFVGATFGAPTGQSAMDEIAAANEGQQGLDFIDIHPDPILIPEGAMDGIIKKNPHKLWDNKLVAYSFETGFSDADMKLVRQSLDAVEEVTCIRFKEYSLGKAPGHYVRISDKGGCWSYVGKALFSSGYQDMSLGRGCLHKKVIIHEFIHALGAYHEQARPDRDNYIRIIKENMAPGAWNQFEKRREIDSMGVEYDGQSIMHYGGYAFSKNRRPTMEWRANPNQRLGGTHMTQKDIQQLNLLYSCSGTPPPPPPPITTTTMKPTTTTTEPTTTMEPKECMQKKICETFPKDVCSFPLAQKDCPILCGKCEGKTTTPMTSTTEKKTTATPTTTTTPMTTTTEEMTTSTMKSPTGGDCYDVSKYCRGSGPNCNNSIYQRRCRKSCNLCSKPLPTECQGKRDSSSSNCVSLISSGQCRRNNVKMQCEQSCCLRNYR